MPYLGRLQPQGRVLWDPCLLPLEVVTVFYAMSCSLRCWLSWVYMDGSRHEPGGDCRISSGKVAQPIPEVIIAFLPD